MEEQSTMQQSPMQQDPNQQNSAAFDKKKAKKKGGAKKWIIIIAAVAVVFIIGAVVLFKSFMNKAKSAMDNKTVVQEYGMHDMTSYISTKGTVESQNVQCISTRLQYPIDEIKVSVGDKVKKGQVVCTIETDDIDKQITNLESKASDEERAQAKQLETSRHGLENARKSSNVEISSAAEALDEARKEYESAVEAVEPAYAAATAAQTAYETAYEKATPGDAVAEAALKDLKKAYETAYATAVAADESVELKKAAYDAAVKAYNKTVEASGEAIQSAQDTLDMTSITVSSVSELTIQLAELYEQKENSVIKSDVSGIVTSVSGTEGQVCQGTILQIEDNENLQIKVEIKERDIFKVKEGQEVTISNDSLQDIAAEGVVDKVVNFVASSEDASTNPLMQGAAQKSSGYSAVIKVTSGDGLLLGMTVKTKIAMGAESSLFSVPYTAIITDSDETSKVYIAKEVANGMYQSEEVEVETGEVGDYYTEIVSGDLKQGDLVILYPDTITSGSLFGIEKQDVKDAQDAEESASEESKDSTEE